MVVLRPAAARMLLAGRGFFVQKNFGVAGTAAVGFIGALSMQIVVQ